jgi:hypothetical protein
MEGRKNSPKRRYRKMSNLKLLLLVVVDECGRMEERERKVEE